MALADRQLSDDDLQWVVGCVERLQAAWPTLSVTPEVCARVLASQLAPEASVSALDSLDLPDLYLAHACSTGDPAAISAFESRYAAVIDHAVASAGALPAERADLGQVVRQRLLVAPADATSARIASYSGKGSLAAWVRVVATREAARMLPRERRERGADDDELVSMIARDDDPEIGYLKRLYRHEFKLAFQAAVAALDDRARLLLRQHTLDRLGIDQLATQYGVHRATAARWLETARKTLMAKTQYELIQRLRLSRSELASLMRLIESHLDVSLPRILSA